MEPRLDVPVARRDDLRHQADTRARLLDPQAVGRRDQDALERVAVDTHDLGHLRAEGTRRVVDLPEPRHLVGGGQRFGGALDGVHG